MSISDEIQQIVADAKASREDTEKTAAAQEAAERAAKSPVASGLRKIAQSSEKIEPGIDHQFVVDFIRELR